MLNLKAEFERIKGCCKIDDITGCWEWAGAYSVRHSERNGQRQTKGSPVPTVWTTALDGKSRSMTAFRAAWLASGKALPAAHHVWRSCWNPRCVCPKHLVSGTAQEKWAAIKESGVFLGNPKRRLAEQARRVEKSLPKQVIQTVQELLEQGLGPSAIQRRTGVCIDTIRSVRNGTHVHCAGRDNVIPSASVFTWRPQ